jgi:hypothetical protein
MFILADFLSLPYTAFNRGGHDENRPMVAAEAIKVFVLDFIKENKKLK